MKLQTLTVLAAILTSGLCDEEGNITSFLYTDENGETWLEDLTQTPNLTHSPNDVVLYFFSRQNGQAASIFKSNDASNIKKTHFNAAKPTVFIIHGWHASHTSDINRDIKNALLRAYDVNVFVVDWNPIAKANYVTAHAGVGAVGQYLAEFVNLLVKNGGLQIGNARMVGHSLGAHVAGNAGKALHGKLSSITGLDPAGPLFLSSNRKVRLDNTDAQFVEAIHTNAAVLGVNYNVGHVDYWPNGGRWQPGCVSDSSGACSHMRSYKYFEESLKSNKFVARKCANYKTFNAGKCKSNAASSMGMFNEDRKASGSYFLKTKSSSPFAEG